MVRTALCARVTRCELVLTWRAAVAAVEPNAMVRSSRVSGELWLTSGTEQRREQAGHDDGARLRPRRGLEARARGVHGSRDDGVHASLPQVRLLSLALLQLPLLPLLHSSTIFYDPPVAPELCTDVLSSSYTQPLFIQALMGLKTLYDAKPVSIHLLGKPAEGDLKRPFKVGGMFGGTSQPFHPPLSLRLTPGRLALQPRRTRRRTRPRSTRPRSGSGRRTTRASCLSSAACVIRRARWGGDVYGTVRYGAEWDGGGASALTILVFIICRASAGGALQKHILG